MRRRAVPDNLGLLFHWHAERSVQTVLHADRPFDIAPDRGTRHTVAELAELVDEFAGALHAAGLRRADRVAIVKQNHYDMTLAAAAAARLGAVPALLSGLCTVEDLTGMMAKLRPRMLVVAADILDRAAAAGVRLADGVPTTMILGRPATGPPAGAVLADDVRGAPFPGVRVLPPGEAAVINHTSGTTGVPKLVKHAFTSTCGSYARIEGSRLPLVINRPHDTVAVATSFAHARMLTWTAAQLQIAPRKLVVISEHAPATAAATLAAHRPTTMEACPNIFMQWEQLADERPDLFADVRLFITTFDAVHPRTVRTFLNVSRRRLPIWAHGWGQSETGPLCGSVFTRRSVRRRPGPEAITNVGWRMSPRIRIVDPVTGRRVPRGGPGLLLTARKARLLGYVGETDRFARKNAGGWWNTGDIGERLPFGRIRLLDREVDALPDASCIELESILLDRLPAASEVVVLGRRDGPPVPVLSIRDGAVDPGEWRRATADLPELAEPRVIGWDDFPRTATLKVRRTPLRELVLGSKDATGTGTWT